jgi:hypothetical protein
MRTLSKARSLFFKAFAVLGLFLVLQAGMQAQETTGALQGTVKDPSGAVVVKARVTVATPTLVGTKSTLTDSNGYYRFSNLPSGTYVITVEAKGFSTLKQQGLNLSVGRIPTIDLTLAVGSDSTVVEVASTNPAIDVTSVMTQSNVSQDVIDYVPRGRSYQSVIQFAPSARQEPLMGNTTTNGTGGTSPGSATNGNSYGYSVAGGSDSENAYLVEGQETANLIGGYSHTNVPFDFIDQVEIRSSGVVAEYGGALGGVVNVIMKKGTTHYHGSAFLQFENQSMDASASNYFRYNPISSPAGFADATVQSYQPKKDRSSDVFPGFTFGGPLVPYGKWRDKLFFFVGFNPEMTRVERNVNYSLSQDNTLSPLGELPFSRNTNTYYTTARIDAQVTSKIRVFASWLYQLQRQNGQDLPAADAVNADSSTFYNGSASTNPSSFSINHGYTAPNITFNTGADITITSNLVSTSRFGYYFENYHDFGYPTGGDYYFFENDTSSLGAPFPSTLAKTSGAQVSSLRNVTSYNAAKAIQVDQSFAYFKSGWAGVHNFKFGYQLNRQSDKILQAYNEPYVDLYLGDPAAGSANSAYQTGGPVGDANCAAFIAKYGQCQGADGYLLFDDYGTAGKVTSYNHGFFAQDSWTIGKGLTVDAGLRIEKEFLPGVAQGSGVPAHPINFGWGDKIAPRVGAAWDILRNGKVKAFGGYGVYNDIMKLNVAISSFGGQYWNNCAYAVDSTNINQIQAAFNTAGRFCPSGDSSTPAVLGSNASGLTFLENINNRANPTTCSTCTVQEEGVAPGLKPYRQHEADFGVDFQASRSVSFEARWDRRRLDHVIEDAAIYNPLEGETFVIINPGQGVDDTYTHFCNFLYATGGQSGCVSSTGKYPPDQQIAAARSYDGAEFRVTKAMTHHWAGMASYTYSHFRGNYTGLTSSDISDGGQGGRNAPNNSRAFDEPYFQYSSLGSSASGLLPTDRPNTFKGYGYYRLGFLHRFTTDIGIFQTLYQGSPNTSYASVGFDENAYFQQVVGRGKWVDISQNVGNGAITVGSPRVYRNPWYNQTDFNVRQDYKLSESSTFSIGGTFTNLLNAHTVTSVNEQIDSPYGAGSYYLRPGGLNIASGTAFYAAANGGYNLSNALNGVGSKVNNIGAPITTSGLYGQPLTYQLSRKIRISASITF